MKTERSLRPFTIFLTSAVLLILFSGISAGLAGLDIPWWTIDGGGGQSSGGTFALNGTIGQADAGAMSGGNFSLNGGFWSAAATIQAIGLNAGWNMISSYVDPNPAAMSSIFPDAYDETLLCKNGDGVVYWPSMAITDLSTWTAAEGYQCNTVSGFPISLSGSLIPAGTPLALSSGWNLMAYWRNVAIDAATALAGCSSQMVLAKNGNGEIYWPNYAINQIGDMQPGEGYQIYLNSGCSLSYPQ